MSSAPSNSNIPNPDRVIVRHTASSILAKFLPNQRTHHKMDAARPTLRERGQGQPSYAESDASVESSLPTTPVNGARSVIVLGDEIEADQDDEILYADRKSTAGHGLRPKKSLNLSLKAIENGDKRTVSRHSVSQILCASEAHVIQIAMR